MPFNKCPRPLIPYKPDWHAAEVLAPRETDYYESPRALGQLYRRVTLKPPPERAEEESVDPEKDSITFALRPKVLEVIPDLGRVEGTGESEILNEVLHAFYQYQDELSYICATHVITNQPGARLTEEEIVTGTIVAKASPLNRDHFQHLIGPGSPQSTESRWRNERVFRMRLNSSALAHETRRRLTPGWKRSENLGTVEAIKRAWVAWMFSVRNRMQFAANTFGMIALNIIFDGLNDLALAKAKAAEAEAEAAEAKAKAAEAEAQPAESETQPAESEAQPTESEVKPAESEAELAEPEVKHAGSGAEPGGSEVQPAESKVQPAESEAQPAESEVQPEESEVQSVESEVRPVESEVQPAESGAQPAESEAQPAESEAQPAESEVQPVESEVQPVESEAKPAEPEV